MQSTLRCLWIAVQVGFDVILIAGMTLAWLMNAFDFQSVVEGSFLERIDWPFVQGACGALFIVLMYVRFFALRHRLSDRTKRRRLIASLSRSRVELNNVALAITDRSLDRASFDRTFRLVNEWLSSVRDRLTTTEWSEVFDAEMAFNVDHAVHYGLIDSFVDSQRGVLDGIIAKISGD